VKISVVVPAFNEERGLAGALRSIDEARAAFTERGWSSELIVSDNNSTDGTAAIAREAGATVVFEPINQISRARNTGAAHATGDWLVFVDADSHPSRELFHDTANAIASGTCIAGGSTVVLDTDERLPISVVNTWNQISRTLKWAAGSFIFCEAATFRALGGFSQEFYAAEEIELFRRLKRAARATRKEIVILDRHPILTSARKTTLYTPREVFGFMLKTMLLAGRPLKNPADCYQWYDGRR
jgi:glycosyltransferase involved in cell wall biosynthesis